MATIGRLAVKIDADTAGLRTGLTQAERNVADFKTRMTGMTGSVDGATLSMGLAAKAAGALGVAMGAAGVAGAVVGVQRQFDVLNASLVTVTGSTQAAKSAFSWIEKFATETPYQLQEVVGAFIKLKARGLEASEEALRSYGNTASAMGKSLDQMVEAVADATTGQFERLLEFGIKGNKEGENIRLTFKGVETTIRNSSEEITRYLRQIGDVDFASAMVERTKTLDGAISNLGDSWNKLLLTFSQGGFGAGVQDSVGSMTKLFERLTEVMKKTADEGGGSMEQLANSAGLLIGRAAFGGLGSLAGSVNTAVNLMTGGFFDLNENVSVLPMNLRSASEQMAIHTARLVTAKQKQADLVVALRETQAAGNSGIFIKSNLGQVNKEIADLEAITRRARLELSALQSIAGMDFSAENAKFARQGKPAPVLPPPTGGAGGGKATGGGAAKEKSIFDNGDPVQQELQDRADKADSGDAAIRRQEERDKEHEAMRKDFERRAQALRDYHKTEEELKLEKHEKELEQLALDRENGFLTEQEYMLMEQDLAMKHMDELARIRDEGEKRITTLAEMSWSERAAFASKHMTDMTKDLAGQSKAAFNVHKAAAIATALINAKTSISSAYQHGTKMGGPKVGMAFAAAAAIQTAAQINAIKSQQFGGGGTSGASGGGGGAVSGRETGGAAAAPGMQQTITIQGIGAGDIFGGESVRLLIDKLIDAQRNGAKILLA